MDPAFFLIILLISLAVFSVFLNRKINDLKFKDPSGELLEVVKLLKSGSQEDRKILLENLNKNTRFLNDRLDSTARIMSSVQKNIGEIGEIGRSMKDLQEFLKSPKLRGNIGEQVLNEMLTEFLPKQSFHIQYRFKTGEIVDAAIKTSAGIIPIDSKFPMENFRKMVAAESESDRKNYEKIFEKDLKGHIDSISKKYVLTDEGTIDYALMYIPSEAVYYEVVNNPELFEFASSKRILPVSPTTFYAYLKAILMSFEGQKIEAKAKEILAAVRAIQKDYNEVEENLHVLQKHVTNSYNMMKNIFVPFTHLGQKIASTKNLEEKTPDIS